MDCSWGKPTVAAADGIELRLREPMSELRTAYSSGAVNTEVPPPELPLLPSERRAAELKATYGSRARSTRVDRAQPM